MPERKCMTCDEPADTVNHPDNLLCRSCALAAYDPSLPFDYYADEAED